MKKIKIKNQVAQVTIPTRPTQPPILSGTGNKYRPKDCESSAAGK